MQVTISTESIAKINDKDRSFLMGIGKAEGEDEGIPVYIQKTQTDFTFIRDHFIPFKSNKNFEDHSPAHMFRGGAHVAVRAQGGTMGVYDERPKNRWFKPFCGIAQGHEGNDLSKTAARELLEEAFIYSTNNPKHIIRFVPKGFAKSRKAKPDCSLNFIAHEIREHNELKILGFELNQVNKSFEIVYEWDLNDLEIPFSVCLEEDWWQGGHCGIPVHLINSEHRELGLFSGRQGFASKEGGAILRIHPTLEKHL